MNMKTNLDIFAMTKHHLVRSVDIHLPSHSYLDEQGIPYTRLSFPVETEKGAAAVARALGFQEQQMVKTLIFETKEGEFVMILLPGNKNAISGLLKKAISSRNIRLAPPDAILALTGYSIGSIPPFHWQSPTFRSFLDDSLMNESELGVGAGKWGQEIILSPEHLQQAAGAMVVNLTDRERPAIITTL